MGHTNTVERGRGERQRKTERKKEGGREEEREGGREGEYGT